MTAAVYDFEIEQGSDFVLAFSRKDDVGDVIDMTGFLARMQVRRSVSSPDILLALTTEDGRLVVDGALGRVTITLTAAVTAAIDWRKGVYDIEIIDPVGGVSRLMAGKIEISREVTR